jgi:hypothetical protein
MIILLPALPGASLFVRAGFFDPVIFRLPLVRCAARLGL